MSKPDKEPILLDLTFQGGERANMQICKTKQNNLTITDGCEYSEEWRYGSEGLG